MLGEKQKDCQSLGTAEPLPVFCLCQGFEARQPCLSCWRTGRSIRASALPRMRKSSRLGGEHPLVASGYCGLLHLLLPALISPSSATTGPATCEVPFRLAGWLSLPLLRLAEGVEGTLFYLSMVGPERMGAAIDAAMAKAGLSEATAEPVDPAVLRLRLLRAATALHSDAAGVCFEVRPSDMYSLGEPPEGEDSYTPLVTRAEEDLDEPPARCCC